MDLSAEFEAAIMARRVDILALRAEARRLVGEGEDVWKSGITIPAGWLPAMAEGLDRVIYNCEQDAAEGHPGRPVSEEDRLEEAELVEQMEALASAIRDVEPGSDYVVSAPEGEALFKATAGALSIQEYQLNCMPSFEYVDPPILRFIAFEQADALARFFSDLWDMLSQAERDD